MLDGFSEFQKVLYDSIGFYRIPEDSKGFLEDSIGFQKGFYRSDSTGFLEDSIGFQGILKHSRGLQRIPEDSWRILVDSTGIPNRIPGGFYRIPGGFLGDSRGFYMIL